MAYCHQSLTVSHHLTSTGSDDTRNDILIPEKLIALQTMTAAMKDICDRNSISSASAGTFIYYWGYQGMRPQRVTCLSG